MVDESALAADLFTCAVLILAQLWIARQGFTAPIWERRRKP